MSRDPWRIPELGAHLMALWQTMPDMRFFQLVEYIKSELPEEWMRKDPFHVEDDVLRATLLRLLNEPSSYVEPTVVEDTSPVIIYFDGGCRGVNGGADSLCGWAFHDGREKHFYGNSLYGKTNNEMEWQSLVNAMRHALKRGYRNVEFRGDSELVVKQFNGEYQVKKEHLKPFYQRAQDLYLAIGPHVTVKWVPREENKADAHYNRILDRVK